MATNRYRSLSRIVGISVLLAADVYGQEQAHAQRFDTNGLAQVTVDNRAFYIDSVGSRVFDAYENRDQPWPIPADGGADTCAFVVFKDGRKGLRSIRGKWILEPVYQQIEYLFDACWKVTKAGQQTVTTPTGDILPYFDEVGYLDGRYFDVKVDGKWGLYDSETQRLTTPAIYDGFDYCGGCGRKSDYVYAQQNGQWGIISFDNRTLVPFAYEHNHWNGMRSGVWVSSFTKNKKPLVVHIPTGNVFMAADNERLEILNGGELVVAGNGKYGLIDTLCQEILPPVYDQIAVPNDNDYRGYFGSYAIVETQGKKGVYESGRGLVIQPEWDDARVYDNYFVLARDGRYGLYDHEGNELLAPELTNITHINDYFYSSGSNGITIFKTKQQALYGLFFAETGVEITPQFHEMELRPRTYGGDATFVVGEYQGEEAIFDLAGNELLPLGYDGWATLDSTVHCYLKITKNGLWGVYDTQRKAEVLPTEFQDIRLLAGSDEQVLTVALDGDDTRYGAYTLEGAEVVPPTFGTYNEISGVASLFSDDWHEGNAILVEGRDGHKITLPNRHATALPHTSLLMISTDAERGRLYHPFEKRTMNDLEFVYSYHSTPDSRLASLGEFSPKGLAWVRTNGQYGLMDTTGQWVKKPLYTAVLPFGERTITVGAKPFPTSDWREQVGYIAYQFIGLDGEPVTDKVYTGPNEFLMDMDYFLGDYLVVRSFDAETGALTVGLADTTGKVVLPTAYDAVEAFGGDRYLLLQKDGKFGIADGRGHILLPVEFDNLLLDRYDKETGITFPLLGYRGGEWRYYTTEGNVLTIEGVGDRAFSVNTSWW